MISLTVALDGVCVIWNADKNERRVPVTDFVLDISRTALEPGELLRAIVLPIDSLGKHTAFRKLSLTPHGRSAAVLIGTLAAQSGAFSLIVSAATKRPFRLCFPKVPGPVMLQQKIDDEIADAFYFDDAHGSAAWRKHATQHFAEEIRRELSNGINS